MIRDYINYIILTDNIFIGENNKYYYFYKITNNVNNNFYYGVHSTKNLNDRYAGSGCKLRKDIKKYGIENFKKEILKFFNNITEMYDYEKFIVTKDLVLNKNCYNSCSGGMGGWDFTLGRVSVKDKDGNNFMVDKDDPRLLSGEVVSNMVGLVHVKDKDGNKLTITTDEYQKYKNIKYFSYGTSKVMAKINGKNVKISKNEYDKLKGMGQAAGVTVGKGCFMDKNGKKFLCDVNDPRVLSGELVGATKGLTIYKYKNDFSKTCFTKKDDPRVLSGELVGINYGIVYCRNPFTGEKIKTTKDDPRLLTGEIITSNKYAKLYGEPKTLIKKYKTKEEYYLKYKDIIDLYNDNKPISFISEKLEIKDKKVRYVLKRYLSFNN